MVGKTSAKSIAAFFDISIFHVKVLFSLCPHTNLATFVHLDVNHIRTATHRAILDVLLLLASRKIDRDYNLFTTRITNV